MSAATRPYTDGGGTDRDHHIDSRSIGGSSADVYKTQETGGRLDFGGAATGNLHTFTTTEFSAEKVCDGYESIVLKFETSKSNPNIEIRVWRGDGNATTGWTRGEKLSVPTSPFKGTGDVPTLKTGYYHAGPLVIPTYGAKVFKVQVVTLSKGSAEAWWSLH